MPSDLLERSRRYRVGELDVDPTAGIVSCGVDRGTWLELDADLDVIRTFTRTGEGGRYRPLSGARTLRRGWRVRATGDITVEAIIDAVYPLATTHRKQWAAATLRAVPLEAVIARQAGRYQSAAELPAAGRQLASGLLCGQCVRVPVWRGDLPGPLSSGPIPCPEPCSVLLSFVREAAEWQRDRPVSAPPDPTVPFAAFDQPGNELRESYLSGLP